MRQSAHDFAIARLQTLRHEPPARVDIDSVEARLMQQFPAIIGQTSGIRGCVARHRTIVAVLALLLACGVALAATAIYWAKDHQITVSDADGNVLMRPRILVADGQSAFLQIIDPESDEPVIGLTVDSNGEVTADRDDVIIDVESRDVIIDEQGAAVHTGATFITGSRQVVVRFLAADGTEISHANVEVHPQLGGMALLVEYGPTVTVHINPDGTFTCEGCGIKPNPVQVELIDKR